MNDFEHRAGVTEVNLVIRKLQLKGLTEVNRAKIVSEIDEVFGIDNATFDIKDSLLHIAYDATHINLDAIKLIIRKYGADISDDWWGRLKEGYYKFVDQNVKENADHKPSCCSRPPPQNKRHK